jgi:hypothetical protein
VDDDAIFVQIPAYRDPELPKTLIDLYARASRPSRLRTVVVWQHDDDETLDRRVRRLPGLEIVDVPASDSEGCNWARRQSQERWSGEPFTLLLDSHHRFVLGWDDLLLRMYAQLRGAEVDKPLLTAYLPAYDPARDPLGRRHEPYRICAHGREEGILTRLIGNPIHGWRALSAPVPAAFLSLHLVFAAGTFNDEIVIDPTVYFSGDEVLMGLRAFTAGYDLYHPHRVVGWHCYDRGTRVPHWDDHPSWRRRHRLSLAMMSDLYRGTAAGPDSGLPRTLADYEAHIGTSLWLRGPAPTAP